MTDKIARVDGVNEKYLENYIGKQTERTVETVMEQYRTKIFAELNDIKAENEILIKGSVPQYVYGTSFNGYEYAYPGDAKFDKGESFDDFKHPLEEIQKFNYEPSKLTSESPKRLDKKYSDVDGFQRRQTQGNYSPTNKLASIKEKSKYQTTLNDISQAKTDLRFQKATLYDLTGKGDWRKGMSAYEIRGPIDHVSKNKHAFKRENRINDIRASGGTYLKRGKYEQMLSEQYEKESKM